MDSIIVLGLVTVITLRCLDNVQGAPSSPGVAPIPPAQLYAQFLININKPGCKPKRIKNIASFSKCMDGKEALLDYGCRYYNVLQPYCYCCGQTCTYVELGEVCTKYCLAQSGSGVGQEAIIDLPFNWGDDPSCTQQGGNSSTKPNNKSDDLQIQQVNVADVVDTKEDAEIAALPSQAMIESDCMGNNCITDRAMVAIPRIPPTIVPDCVGGNCPENVTTGKRKRKESSGPIVFEIPFSKENGE